MYSVVMMMAMSGAPDMPAFGRKNGCDGGGCHGYAGSCNGGGGGCHGYADSCGCHGGRASRRDRHGCHGGCHGGGCSGYSGGCSGYSAGCGCCGTMSACGGCAGYSGGMMTAPPAATPPPPAMPPKDGKSAEAMIAAPATIVVSLPAEASLKIDGVATKQVSGVRQFTTPTLAAGQSFYYTLTAEVVRNGQTLSSVQTISVRAGEQTSVALPVEQFAQTIAMK